MSKESTTKGQNGFCDSRRGRYDTEGNSYFTLATQGIEVIDSRDVRQKNYRNSLEVDADIIGTSALLSTTLTGQKKLEDESRKEESGTVLKPWWSPCTQRWADKIGQMPIEDAAAVEKALERLGRR